MTLRRTFLGGAVGLLAGITLLHVYFNGSDLTWGPAQDSGGRFRVGFLPVT
jgi:hypothetical protein